MRRDLAGLAAAVLMFGAAGCAEQGRRDPIVDQPAQTGDLNGSARLAVFNFYASLSNSEPGEACKLVDDRFEDQNTPDRPCAEYLESKLGADPKYLSPNVPRSAMLSQSVDRARVDISRVGQNLKDPFGDDDSTYLNGAGVVDLARSSGGWLITASGEAVDLG
ncbi:hypothetical protein [Solicola sp. PLA-1-18]|uniref:hypothetical protein n=1 Tax=Solicola sp. PLA-1-18 TaxID=3380532 RepID=UPI003B7E14B5